MANGNLAWSVRTCRSSAEHEAVDTREVAEAGATVEGDHGALRRRSRRRNDQVVGPALGVVAMDDRQERAVDLRHCHVVALDRDQPQDLLEKGRTGVTPTR